MAAPSCLLHSLKLSGHLLPERKQHLPWGWVLECLNLQLSQICLLKYNDKKPQRILFSASGSLGFSYHLHQLYRICQTLDTLCTPTQISSASANYCSPWTYLRETHTAPVAIAIAYNLHKALQRSAQIHPRNAVIWHPLPVHFKHTLILYQQASHLPPA